MNDYGLFLRVIFCSFSLEIPKLEDSTYQVTIPVQPPGSSSSTPVTTGMPGVGGPEVNALPVSVIVFSLPS